MSALITVEEVRKMPKAEKDALKLRMQTDVFFMANQVLRQHRFPPLLYSFHGRICETFVEPDPTKPVDEWSEKRTRVILACRGELKSVLCAVWLTCLFLCAPNTRVLVLSGEASQAESIVRMVQSNLLNPVVQYLFPAYKPKSAKKLIAASEYWCPARDADDNTRDASLSCSTFHSTRAGKHADVLVLDDITNEGNCGPTMVEKTLDSWADTRPVGNPNHLTVCLATRWIADPDSDLPMVIVNEDPEDCVLTTLPIWTVKTTGSDKEIKERTEREKTFKLKPDDVVFGWPRLNSRKVWNFYRRYPKQFALQYLLSDAFEVRKAVFSEGLIGQSICDSYSIGAPHLSDSYLNFDLASVGSSSELGDDCCGMVFVRNKVNGRLVLVDGFVEKFSTSTELAVAIVDLIRNYAPKLVRIESSLGAPLLLGEIISIAKSLSLDVRDRIIFEVPDNRKDAKRVRIFGLAGQMSSGRVRVYENYRDLDVLRKQLNKFTSTSRLKGRDDAADCLASAVIWLNSLTLEEIDIKTLQPRIPDFDPIPVPSVRTAAPRRDFWAEQNERGAAPNRT